MGERGRGEGGREGGREEVVLSLPSPLRFSGAVAQFFDTAPGVPVRCSKGHPFVKHTLQLVPHWVLYLAP